MRCSPSTRPRARALNWCGRETEGAPTVFSAIDRTVTAAGARELMSRLVSPSSDVELINGRLDAVAALIEEWALRERVRTILKTAPDMSRALSRLKLKRGGPRDLGAIRDGLAVAKDLSALLAGSPAQPAHLADILSALSLFSEDAGAEASLARTLERALADALPFFTRDGGFIASGYDAALDELRELQSSTKVVLAKLQADYAAKTGIKSLKIQYNQVFGYFVEVGPASAAALQAEPHAARLPP